MKKLCCSGVRGFDLRVDIDKDNVFRVEHTFLGAPFATVLRQFSEFAQLHQREIIFLDIVASKAIIEQEELQKKLVELIELELSARVFRHPAPSATVGEFWSAKSNFVLFSELAYEHTLSRKMLACAWPNASSAAAVISHIARQNVLGARTSGEQSKEAADPFCWLQCQTTPSPAQAIAGLFKSGTSLTSNADISNKSVLGYIAAHATPRATVNFFGIDHCNSCFGKKFYLLSVSMTIARIPTDKCGRVMAGSPSTAQPPIPDKEKECPAQLSQERVFTLEARTNGKRYVLEPQSTIDRSLVTVREYSPKYLTKQQLWRSDGFRIVHVGTGLSLASVGAQLAVSTDTSVAWVFDGTRLEMIDDTVALLLENSLFTVSRHTKRYTPIKMRFIPKERVATLPEVVPVKRLPHKYELATPSEMNFFRPMFLVYVIAITTAVVMSFTALW